MARIFICGDTGQTALLDGVSATLKAEGHDVVRGPTDDNGQLKTYSSQDIETLIAPSEVAVFTTRHACSRAVMEASARLRGVCYPVTGVETLDLDAAADLGIIVGHGAVPENVTGMAEATLMLMLMLMYGVEGNIGRLKRGAWRSPAPAARQMAGKTIGMVGFGRIAREVAARLRPFAVRILTTTPYMTQADMPDGVALVDLNTLLRESDLVSLLTVLTDETRNMIGATELAQMKPDAFLLNTSRGAVIDEVALIEALRERRIAGAALDAYAVEPLPGDSPLRRLDNVILTPHSVGHTVESVAALEPALLENIRAILRGDLPPVCKNPEVEPAWRLRLGQLAA